MKQGNLNKYCGAALALVLAPAKHFCSPGSSLPTSDDSKADAQPASRAHTQVLIKAVQEAEAKVREEMVLLIQAEEKARQEAEARLEIERLARLEAERSVELLRWNQSSCPARPADNEAIARAMQEMMSRVKAEQEAVIDRWPCLQLANRATAPLHGWYPRTTHRFSPRAGFFNWWWGLSPWREGPASDRFTPIAARRLFPRLLRSKLGGRLRHSRVSPPRP